MVNKMLNKFTAFTSQSTRTSRLTRRLVVLAACSFLGIIPANVVAETADAKDAAQSPPPRRQTHQEMMTVELDRTVVELPIPADAGARRAAFARRNDPEQIEALAKELFALWNPSERRTAYEPLASRLQPLKAEALKQFQAKNYQESLDAFRAYFFAKMRLLFKDSDGYTSSGFENRLRNDVLKRNYEDTVTLLMDNVYQVRSSKETLRIGEPGLVRWDFQPAGPNLWGNIRSVAFQYFSAGASPFARLWWKFTDTGEPRYLDHYLAFLDDYAMNQTLQEELNIGNLDLGKGGTGDAFAYLHSLAELSKVLPPDGSGYSSASLARMLVRLLTIDIPQSLYYNREQSNNHSCVSITVQLQLANYLLDFKLAKILETETRRQFEAYGTLFDLPDGDMPGRMRYNNTELQWNLQFFRMLHDFEFDWLTRQQRLEYTDRLTKRAATVITLHNANGEGVQLYKADRRNAPFDNFSNGLTRNLPETWNDPAQAKIAARIIHNQQSPDWQGRVYLAPDRPAAREGLGVEGGAEPPYTSISLPYAGTHVLRSGWNPRRDAYGIFVESGGGVHGTKCSNSLFIGGFGQDVLHKGFPHQYNYIPSPVLVDGRDQFSGLSGGPAARKGGESHGLTTQLRPLRIHHGKHFDVVEGFYNEHWVNAMDHDPEFYDHQYKLDLLERAIHGVSHRRVVQFVKEHGVWIVYDIMRPDSRPSPSSPAPSTHTYTQQFFMRGDGDTAADGYRAGQFVVDQAARTLKSTAPDRVNLNLYYAGPAAEKLEIAQPGPKLEMEDKYAGEYRSDRRVGPEFLHLKSRWQASDDSLLITVLQTTDPGGGGDPVADFARRSDGFTATLASGATLDGTARLVAVSAANPAGLESRLTVTGSTGESGVVLGADSHVFSRRGGGATDKTPIHTPVPELSILPERNVFVDTLDVILASPDPEVAIHYTLDGTDPTLASPLYAGPVTLTGSAMVKARAFRPELKETPADTTSGVLMSQVFTAVYTRQAPLAADPLDEAQLKPGLKFSYYQGTWPRLLFGAPTLQPVKTGDASGLFDLAANQGHDGAFGFVYEGYLQVPEDGVYTIHAPEEFMQFRPLAGYDLNVSLGRRVSYVNGEPRTGAALNEWYPATRRHTFGNWSVALEKGMHPVRVYYADFRPGGSLEYYQFTYPDLNVPGLTKTFFDGDTPQLELSGPGIERQPIPSAWLKRR